MIAKPVFSKRRPAGRAGVSCCFLGLLITLAAVLPPAGPILAAPEEEDPWAAPKVVRVKTHVETREVMAGDMVRAAIQMDIDEGWHVNAHEPLEEFLIPTEVFLADDATVAVGRTVYPAPEVRKLAISDVDMALYEERAVIGIEVQIPPDQPHGDLIIGGVVSYQACDDEKCLAPDEEPFMIRVTVGDTRGDRIGGAAFDTIDWSSTAAAGGGGGSDDDFAGRSLALIFLGTFAAGLALNLTPCVYPMIPITISVFGGQGGGPRRALAMSIFYVIGMAITYSAIGTFAALTGSLLGSALQNPLVLIFVAAVMLLMALSMFGLYDIQMPQALNRIASESRQGYLGTLFMGLTVGIIAAPCIGPFVLGLLTFVGSRGNPVLGFSLFFVLALGLGLPFMVLAVLSGSVSALPRSGGWMVWVKKVFAFILVAMAIYFLTRSDRLIPERLFLPITALTAFVAGIYLGWIDKSSSFGGGFTRVKRAVGVICLLASVALVVAPQVIETPTGITWSEYDASHLAGTEPNAQPIIVDFSAAWCIPCKELEHVTFTAEPVVSLAEHFVTLKADLTNQGSDQVKQLKEQFRIRGVPTVIFLYPDGTEMEDLRFNEWISAEEFLGRMEQALDRTRQGV